MMGLSFGGYELWRLRTFLVWRLRIGHCSVGARGFWHYRMHPNLQGCYKIVVFNFPDFSLTKIADFPDILQSLPNHTVGGLSLEEIHILDVTCLRYVLLILYSWSAMPKNVYPVVFILRISRVLTQRLHRFLPLLTDNIFFPRFPWRFQVFPDRGIFSLTSLTCNSPVE